MQDTDVFVKTDAGRDEIKSRTRGLSMPVRAILLMVDGQRTVADMRALIAGSKAPADALDLLLAKGLIASRDGTAFAADAAVPASRMQAAAPRGVRLDPSIAPSAPVGVVSYDGPLDLVLPTIAGDGSGDAAVIGDDAPHDRYNQLYAMMNEIVRDFLPPHRRYFFQLKIERCTTADELMVLLSDLQTALSKGRGDAFASDVIARLRSATS